jgi:bleomycin hydrolase
LELPDNCDQDQFLNLHPDTLMSKIDQALFSGHPVCWEGDISEPGFNWPHGIARLDRKIDRESLSGDPLTTARQLAFENGETTDDHCMELIGIARTPRGRKFYVAKNSWGTGNAYKGLMYLSENYLRLKTIAVWMTQEAFEN